MNKQHNIIYELTLPVSRILVTFYNRLEDAVLQYQVNRMRKQVLHRKLENLTDPTFLDRALGVIK